jgi:two-component system sensor histidine kinase KdpD
MRERLFGQVWAYALTIGVVGLTTGVGVLARLRLDRPDVVMLYLLAVVIVAARFGRGPSLLAATLSTMAFEFFFNPPLFTFTISEDRHLLTFILMLVVGLLTSGLTLRIRKHEHEARNREERVAILYELSRDLTSAVDAEQAALVTTRHAAKVCRGGAAVFAADGAGAGQLVAQSGINLPVEGAEQDAIRWAFQHGRSAGRGTDAVPGARLTCVPLMSGSETFGVLSFSPQASAAGGDQRHFLDAFARLAALALERARLAKQAEAAAVRATTEEMRSSLLSAVSHDLRTPLAAITGAATTLRDRAAEVDPAQRAELLDMICEEADRLERLVRNLLDMTQLHSGALHVKREWIPLEEIVGSALTRLERTLAAHTLRTDLPVDLPLVCVDAVLLEQVLVNLLENAAKYTPAGSSIEISARGDDLAVVIEVADRGPGLPPGHESRIFEKFFRGRPGGAPGAGLGLAICRGVVAAHEGTLVAANRDGGGAVFRVTLPVVGKPPSAPPDLESPLPMTEPPP